MNTRTKNARNGFAAIRAAAKREKEARIAAARAAISTAYQAVNARPAKA